MDNKLRIKRVKEGIRLLERGVDPYDIISEKPVRYAVYFGFKTSEGASLLYSNGAFLPKGTVTKNGFIWDDTINLKIMLHNWKRFLELIEKIK